MANFEEIDPLSSDWLMLFENFVCVFVCTHVRAHMSMLICHYD